MPSQSRKLLYILGGVALGFCLTVVAVGAWVQSLGMIQIEVREDGPGGSDVRLRIPAVLVHAGLPIARHAGAPFGPDGVLRDHDRQLVRALLREIQDLPDCDLVRVEDADARVLITKRDRTIIIQADDEGESVYLSVPVRTARRIAEMI